MTASQVMHSQIHYTNLLLDQERKKKMGTQEDFEREVNDSVISATPDSDPIMDATKGEKMTSLNSKAIDIKGKKYVLVSDRILAFNEMYPTGSITSELLSAPSDEMVVIKATVSVNGRIFSGHSQAKWGDGYINKTSAMENCETSAVGRALAMMGIGVIDSIASVDEIHKAENTTPYVQPTHVVPDNQMTAKCKDCQAVMEERSGTKDGKTWSGLFCPNAVKGDYTKHKAIWL